MKNSVRKIEQGMQTGGCIIFSIVFALLGLFVLLLFDNFKL